MSIFLAQRVSLDAASHSSPSPPHPPPLGRRMLRAGPETLPHLHPKVAERIRDLNLPAFLVELACRGSCPIERNFPGLGLGLGSGDVPAGTRSKTRTFELNRNGVWVGSSLDSPCLLNVRYRRLPRCVALGLGHAGRRARGGGGGDAGAFNPYVSLIKPLFNPYFSPF
jgi:hypothetical protein